MGHVYLIHMGDTNYFKVGISRDVNERLASLQTATPFALTLLDYAEQEKPLDVERDIHRALSNCQVRNEWFQCDEAHIRKVFADYNQMAAIDSALVDPVTPMPVELVAQRFVEDVIVLPAEAAKIATLLATLPASEVVKRLDGYSPRKYAELKAKVDYVKDMIGA